MNVKDLSYKILEQIPVEHIYSFLDQLTAKNPKIDQVKSKAEEKEIFEREIRRRFHATTRKK